MFRKIKQKKTENSPNKKNIIPSIITKDVSVLGNIISEGDIDFDGTLNGNIRCNILIVRANGMVKGEVMADEVHVYGAIKGLIRAKTVQFLAGCNVEGIIMHETITIEDGAMIDGKFKRTNKEPSAEEQEASTEYSFDEIPETETKILDNIRLIR